MRLLLNLKTHPSHPHPSTDKHCLCWNTLERHQYGRLLKAVGSLLEALSYSHTIFYSVKSGPFTAFVLYLNCTHFTFLF